MRSHQRSSGMQVKNSRNNTTVIQSTYHHENWAVLEINLTNSGELLHSCGSHSVRCFMRLPVKNPLNHVCDSCTKSPCQGTPFFAWSSTMARSLSMGIAYRSHRGRLFFGNVGNHEKFGISIEVERPQTWLPIGSKADVSSYISAIREAISWLPATDHHCLFWEWTSTRFESTSPDGWLLEF